MIPVHVSGGELSAEEKKAYIDRAREKYPDKQLAGIDITVDGTILICIIVLSLSPLSGSAGSPATWSALWIGGTMQKKRKKPIV